MPRSTRYQGAIIRDHHILLLKQEKVLLYRRLAMLRHDVPLQERIADLEWRGAHQHLKQLCGELGSNTLPKRVPRWIA